MSSNFHLKDVLVNSQYPFIAISSFLAATTIIAVILYTKRPKQNEPIPLFVAETSGKWNYKKRWIFDSSNLLKEAYKKVWNEKNVLKVAVANHFIVPRPTLQNLDNRGNPDWYSPEICGGSEDVARFNLSIRATKCMSQIISLSIQDKS